MKIKVSVSTGYVGSENEDFIEIQDWEVADMSAQEKEEYINEQAFSYMLDNMISWTWGEVK